MKKDLGTKPDKGSASNSQTAGSADVPQSFPLPVEQTNIVLLAEALMWEAETFVAACQYCSEFAEISFDYLLDAITGCDPSQTEYVMPGYATCPRCSHPITEKTLIVPV